MLYNNNWKAVLFTLFFFVFMAFIYFGNWYFTKPEPQTSSISSTLEDRCKFKIKTSDPNFTITENSAGAYNYELYMRSDGYVEVWECPPAVIK